MADLRQSEARHNIGVGTIVEERHKGFYPWEGKQRGEVIAADAEAVWVKWQPWNITGQRIERNRIGDKMTDLIRPVGTTETPNRGRSEA